MCAGGREGGRVFSIASNNSASQLLLVQTSRYTGLNNKGQEGVTFEHCEYIIICVISQACICTYMHLYNTE